MGRGRRDKVFLSLEQRQRLEAISHNGYAPAKKILHAQVLLMSDEGTQAEQHWTDGEIGAALNLHINTVARIRQRFVQQGEQPALNRRRRKSPPTPAKIDGQTEAQIIALCCSEPPCGRVHSLSEAVNIRTRKKRSGQRNFARDGEKDFKKNELHPWKKQRFCIPQRDLARFVAQMEVVLDLYTTEAIEDEPLICMDEASVQLRGHLYEPIPLKPGHDAFIGLPRREPPFGFASSLRRSHCVGGFPPLKASGVGNPPSGLVSPQRAPLS